MHQGLLEINDGLVQFCGIKPIVDWSRFDPIELNENPNYRSVRVRDVGL